MAAAAPKLGPLASKALTQAGIAEQKQAPPVDLAARLDTPLDDLVKQTRKAPRSLLERARAKAGAKAKGGAKAKAGETGVAKKVAKKVIAKDAKAAVRSILSSSQSQKPKGNAPRPAPRLVPAGAKKITISRKPAAAAHHKAAAKPAAAPKLTISLKNDRKPKPAARVQVKAHAPGAQRAIVVANTGQKRQDQRQQVQQARRIIQAPAAAAKPAAAKGGLTLSERFSQQKKGPQHQQQSGGGGGGRKVNIKGGRQGGASFRVNLS